MSSEYDVGGIDDATALASQFQNAHGVARVRQLNPPNSGGHEESMRYALYIEEGSNAGTVITGAQMVMSSKSVDAWVENPGNGGVVVIGVGGLNPNAQQYPPLADFHF